MLKWEPCSLLGLYLGRSPCYGGNVALVLNPWAMHVSHWFYVVLYDEFTIYHISDWVMCLLITQTWYNLVVNSQLMKLMIYDEYSTILDEIS